MDREIIIPEEMREIVARAGYVPAVKVGDTIYVVGQVGRTRDLQVIEDPQEQFGAMWENLRIVLEAADCTFDDVVEIPAIMWRCRSTWISSGRQRTKSSQKGHTHGPGSAFLS